MIPDPHAHPDYDNDRFTALGKFIQKQRPDVVLCLGDFADMPSLSSYDKGKKSFEGRRYKRDTAACRDAVRKLMRPVKYGPRWIITFGNHEDRIFKVCNDSPELDGVIGTFDLGFDEWEQVPFRSAVKVGGIMFSHWFPSGVMARPISGENIARALITKNHMSSVQGHSHLNKHDEQTRPDGQKIFGLSAGCFIHPRHTENWNKDVSRMYWRGVIQLNDLDGEGYYDELREITLRKLMREFG